jgi:Amt family ammonium transporter
MALDTGTTAWLLVATALVILMTPGVGLFYGGMVRKKNFISMFALSFVALAVVSLQWVLVGYSLAFGADAGGLIGDLSHVGLAGVGLDPGDGTYPPVLFAAFQLAFAAVTLAVITSAVAERARLTAFIVVALLWTTLVYDPIAHWAWGGGWAQQLGLIDFAGGTVVEICSGFSALALALVIGRRVGFGEYSMEPHNIPMALLGGALLWFGWFGFNAGSALAADGIAANAFLTTNTAAAAGAVAWLLVSWSYGRPASIGMITGAVAGLVAITPAAGYVSVPVSALVGGVAGVLCYGAMVWRLRRQYDESLDAFAVHGVGGLWGTIATGVLATTAVNQFPGLLEGDVQQFLVNTFAALAIMAYAFGATYLIARLVDRLIGLRVTEDEEYVGLDIAQHGERISY